MSDGLTLEKMKVVERLNSLESKFDVLIAELKIKNENMESNVDKLNHIILGNGQKGIAERVRNLEDSENKRQKVVSVFGASIIGLIAKQVWDFISK